MSNTNSLDEKEKVDPNPKDGDIPFILCTPTKNGDDEVDVDALILIPFDFDAEESPTPRLNFNFILKPRRSCKCKCRCPLGCHHEHQNNMNTDTDSTWTWNGGADSSSRDLTDKELKRNISSSPMPTLQSFAFDVTVTPPVINLLKRCPSRSPSQERNQEGNDDGYIISSSKMLMLPLFPSLGHQHQQQQQHPALRRPIARRPR